MRISNYETALKLSKITGRPLEDFYDGIIPSENEQDKEEEMESNEEECECKSSDDVPEIRDREVEPLRRVPIQVQDRRGKEEDVEKNGEATLYTIKYGGRLSENGVVIGHTKDMTNAEYKSLTKKMTQNELLKSPLLFVFFRAIDQTEGHFWNWLEKFPKE